MEVVDIYRTQKKRKQKPLEALLKIILKEKFCFVNAFVLTILQGQLKESFYHFRMNSVNFFW
jgi:hypothetical protein